MTGMCDITIGHTPFVIFRRIHDHHGIQLFDIVVEGELYAIGWYADCNWLGSLSEAEISGMRVRKGNILIGDARTLNSIYREQRFNGWVQGELFVVTDKLVPNARRDDFEQNDAYKKLMRALYDGIGNDITKTIREASAARNNPSARIIQEVQSQVREATETIEEGFNSSVDNLTVFLFSASLILF